MLQFLTLLRFSFNHIWTFHCPCMDFAMDRLRMYFACIIYCLLLHGMCVDAAGLPHKLCKHCECIIRVRCLKCGTISIVHGFLCLLFGLFQTYAWILSLRLDQRQLLQLQQKHQQRWQKIPNLIAVFLNVSIFTLYESLYVVCFFFAAIFLRIIVLKL